MMHNLECGVVVNCIDIKRVKESFVSTIDQERVARHIIKKCDCVSWWEVLGAWEVCVVVIA